MKVIYTASRNLYPYLYPSIISLLEHNDVERIYLLLEDGRLPIHLPKLPKECAIIDVSEQRIFDYDGPNFRSKFTYLSMMRAAYTKVLRKLDKVIQLDCDTIVTDSLEEMWNTDLSNSYFAAVEEAENDHKPWGPKYYNIGVAVFNLEKIRKDKVDDKVISLLNTKKLPFIDQDAWNIVGAETAVDLPVRFNETKFTGITDNPAIVHFAGVRDWYNNHKMFRHKYIEKYQGTHAETTKMIENLEKKEDLEIGEF